MGILKAVFLHNGNKLISIPVSYIPNTKGTYTTLNNIQFNGHKTQKWKVWASHWVSNKSCNFNVSQYSLFRLPFWGSHLKHLPVAGGSIFWIWSLRRPTQRSGMIIWLKVSLAFIDSKFCLVFFPFDRSWRSPMVNLAQRFGMSPPPQIWVHNCLLSQGYVLVATFICTYFVPYACCVHTQPECV